MGIYHLKFDLIFNDVKFEKTSETETLSYDANISQDIYALGITLADVINQDFTPNAQIGDTYVLNYDENSELTRQFKTLSEEELPQLQTAIGKAVHPDPTERFQTMEDFLTALKEAKEKYEAKKRA